MAATTRKLNDLKDEILARKDNFSLPELKEELEINLLQN